MCYRRETLEAIDLDAVQFVGYAFQIEMKLRSKRNGFSIQEVPITFVDRELGTSKMSMNIFEKRSWGPPNALPTHLLSVRQTLLIP